MTQTEYNKLCIKYDAETLGTAQSGFDKRPPERYEPNIWHHKAYGKEFLVMKCKDAEGRDDFRAFLFVDRQKLEQKLTPVTDQEKDAKPNPRGPRR